MLQFVTYQNDRIAEDWPLPNPYLIGRDEKVLRGDVRYENQRIVCRTPGQDPIALCLLHEVEGFGQFMLQTNLLPPRDDPYLLSLELARHRIQLFIAKSEEWQMFDLSSGHPAMRHWEEARRLFTEALIQKDPSQADQRARTSLVHAMEATERLAMAHAEILLHRRYGQRSASSMTLGVHVWPERDAQSLKDIVSSEFDLLAVPTIWRELEVEEGKYKWDALDRWVDWAHQLGKPIVAGPLLDFSKRSIPEWMHVWQHDYDTCRDLAYDHIERVVTRYRDSISMWNIGCGLNINDNFTFTPEQMIDLTRMAALLVRQTKKGARVMLDLAQPFGEHQSRRKDGIAPLTYLDQAIHSGVRLDAVGVQLLFGRRDEGMTMRDIMQVSALLDRFFLLELPIIVSGMGVPSETIDPEGGWWHRAFDNEVQARWVGRVFAIAMSKPFIETVFWADLYDHMDAPLPRAGLISDTGHVKPSLQRLTSMRKRLRKPLGALKLPPKHHAGDPK